ncbi:T-lymphocyte activation antigen CD86 [Rana temporaria]|uniref:T-lymphocyte activation antigen CD86 n=1 Tax=Rana temporaria TaxID=8407 RepID=UPI001AACAEB7|nr:T-lymphocyte activation antigen CD86 [Rana temporaria]
MAELKCQYNNPDNISRESLNIYWQKNEEVVYALVSGKEAMQFVHKNYVNNTKVLLSNYDLRMYNISLKQSGEYECIVPALKEFRNKNVHKSKFHLNVLANFSVPEISSESSLVELERRSTVSLKCSSGHGFPKPQRMFWQLTDGNGTKEPRYPHYNVENIGETFNISISWTLTVEEDINVTCGLEAHHKAVSPVLQLKLKKPPVPPESDLKMTITIMISVVVLVLVSSLSIILICKQSRSTVPIAIRIPLI